MIRFAAVLLAVFPVLLPGKSKTPDPIKHINAAAEVFDEVNSTPDKGIPQEILEKAHCIGIVPSLKHGGFIVGAKYGRGVLVCRDRRLAGGWTGPDFIRIEGGSIGFQIGAGETDLVFVIMNQHGVDKLMQDKFVVGGDAGAMAGPIGRSASAQTDALMHAEILSYSRARGIFAGIALTGSTLRPDNDENAAYYHRDEVTAQQIVTGQLRPPKSARVLTATINKYVPSARTTKHR
ncbi:MAG TPA: lipid-binding SYLF domain-containing protein [Bryobacteraceae bacterium]|nr:lipid-binding SYLF domain-containing protein [Bryobacteraceae bacterium]